MAERPVSAVEVRHSPRTEALFAAAFADRVLITARETAALLGLDENTLREMADSGAIRSANGNLAVAKKLLGHASITSTVRYAHAMEDDVRRALESVSRNSPGGPSAESPVPHARQRKP